MAVEVAIEEVADNLEELAEATRSINTTALGYFFTGVAVGAGIGFYFGYRFNREKIKADAFKKSEEEIESIREMYQVREQQVKMAAAAMEKPSVEQIVAEKGYEVPEAAVVVERPIPAPVPVFDPGTRPSPTGAVQYSSSTTSVPEPGMNVSELERDAPLAWDYAFELSKRTPDEPYVIHRDEFRDSETNYDQVTYTYYAEDGVLVGEDERPLIHSDIAVGQDNLKWGHGTGDSDLVYIRNDRLQLEIEICRNSGSYEREVLGLDDDPDET